MLRSKTEYKLRYLGPEWSFLAIFGKDNYDTFFTQIDLYKESLGMYRIFYEFSPKFYLDINFVHPYPFFFEDPEGPFYFRKFFDQLKAKGESLFAHTGVFDHRQVFFGGKNFFLKFSFFQKKFNF